MRILCTERSKSVFHMHGFIGTPSLQWPPILCIAASPRCLWFQELNYSATFVDVVLQVNAAELCSSWNCSSSLGTRRGTHHHRLHTSRAKDFHPLMCPDADYMSHHRRGSSADHIMCINMQESCFSRCCECTDCVHAFGFFRWHGRQTYNTVKWHAPKFSGRTWPGGCFGSWLSLQPLSPQGAPSKLSMASIAFT